MAWRTLPTHGAPPAGISSSKMKKVKKYKIISPLGNVVIPHEIMTGKQLRAFTMQLMEANTESEVWHEKILKDPIAEVIDWLRRTNYGVEEI